MAGVRRKGDTDTFQWVNQEVNNSTVWMDACTFQLDCLFRTPLLLYLPLLLMLSLPRRFPHSPQLPTRRGDVKGGAKGACVDGSPMFDWLGRLEWIGVSASEGKAAGF